MKLIHTDIFVIVFSLSLSLLLGSLGGAGIIKCGKYLSLLDRPSDRSSHSCVTPKGGGVGILMAVILFGVLFNLSIYILIPALFISIVGLLGDRVDINPKLRLFFQFNAVLFLLYGYREYIFNTAGIHSDIINLATVLSLSLFWLFFILGTTNFFNFMDGINGIALITAIIAFGLLGVYGLLAGKNGSLKIFCFIIVFSCAGFLPWNFPHAKVFMGDVGSILIGFLYGSIIMVYTESIQEFVLLASFIFLFYADELVTMAERVRDRLPLTQPHRRHLYQVLVNECGIPHWKVSSSYGFIQLIIGITAWLIAGSGLVGLLCFLTGCGFLFLVVNNRIKKAVKD